MLSAITGFAGCSLQPNAGSQGLSLWPSAYEIFIFPYYIVLLLCIRWVGGLVDY
jgi:hypothetical protein